MEVFVEDIAEDGDTFVLEDDDSESEVVPPLKENYLILIKKVRQVVLLFKHSPTKNEDVLQKYVTEKLCKENS